MAEKFADVNSYILSFPAEVQPLLQAIRNLIKTAVPEAVECISYGMPAYKLKGKPLLYFAGYKNHIGVYALPSAHAAFADALKPYKQGKGSVQFPLDQDLPLDLLGQMLTFRLAELAAKSPSATSLRK